MVREALRERFLETLKESGGSAGNTRLRSELGWQEDTYWAVHAALVEDGVVELGRGRGGSVSLVNGKRPAVTTRPRPAAGARREDTQADRPPPRKPENGGRSFEQTFKNIDDVLWKEAGCTTELDYTEQTSWMLFLKYLDDQEQERALRATLEGNRYDRIIEPSYRWSAWAAPKKPDGSFDHDKALTGPDLIDFVNGKLFPYLRGFRTRAEGPNTIEYKIGEIFNEIANRFRSGYSLRDALELIDALRFRSQAERHELSALYEDKIRRMGNAGRNGGEYYTPRPLIRAMVRVVKPRIGERIYDGACGSGGFLCEAFDWLRESPGLSTSDLRTLQERTFYGKEKKSLAYVIAIMNMILHGIDAPNIVHTNTLAENVSDLQDKDRFDVVLANPPFGGKERPEVQQNFPIRTGETAFLFLQHFIRTLKAGGRAGVVIKNTFLSNTDNAAVSPASGELLHCVQFAHSARPAGGDVSGRRGEDGGAVLREGRADEEGLVLPARSGAKPGEDECAGGCGLRGVCPAAGVGCRFGELVDYGCGTGRDGDK